VNILRHPQVLRITGLSRTTLWRLERQGRFPKRLRLASNSVGWLDADIQRWIESRPRGTGSGTDTAVSTRYSV
jgi:prophage regulatory protein